MPDTLAGLLQVGALIAALALCYRPLGTYIAHVFTSERDLRVERGIYRAVGIDPRGDQAWRTYAVSLLAFSVAGLVLLYALQRLQDHLPWSLGLPDVAPDLAFNTAASFVTNTNWQAYSGEATMGHLVQMAGLAVQNFLSAAVGLAVAVALIRGFTRSRTGRLGNFWVDLTRGTIRVLLPLAVVAAVALILLGVVQNLSGGVDATTLTGGHQTIPGGPVASQEAIKELGTNGGGFFNANAAHPFENPNPVSNLFEVFLLLLIPVCLTRTFGVLVGDVRQGYAVLAAMAVIWVIMLAAVWAIEAAHPTTAYDVVGAAMEGKETRIGVPGSALFAVSTTGTSTGAVNSFHSSFSPVGGGLLMLNMGLGEVAPGGVGTGLYGMLVLAILTVFIAGLMVGRTPELLGKKLRAREIKLVALTILTMPLLVLGFTALALSLPGPRESILNTGPHGLSEVLYAYLSGANNNGSAFAGLSANTPFYNITIGLAMLLGRFVPIVLVLALAGSLASQVPVPRTAGTLPTRGPLFVGMLAVVTFIVAGLTFFPALALGPLAEGL
ncbi:potassium-transporting ATPase subunit KdpA [Nocardioides daeguensis]|uniref:Potassium-transporting ATPase potassium-binding subunit n=1 Tax=Nocardioides daeguensis TaxID=908359 RepID=A0ABP6WE76_9ACTN|nr:potassium-transporting ATPase subunit KdpA [Nocardioides daeguensis]MBV6728002.1 potassium-transporting ATPase subunit KdpA [Nocardioides daeguensis]MCR1774076.1 potassium-transporting ATPase subunit KdpA [Nocardioides daeguensis]